MTHTNSVTENEHVASSQQTAAEMISASQGDTGRSETRQDLTPLWQRPVTSLSPDPEVPGAWDRVVESSSGVELLTFRRTERGLVIRVPTTDLSEVLNGRTFQDDRAVRVFTDAEWEGQRSSNWNDHLLFRSQVINENTNRSGTLEEVGDSLYPELENRMDRQWWEQMIWQRLEALERAVLDPNRSPSGRSRNDPWSQDA
ncbi:hypothetical protein IAT40_002575 [Kwoniella sp. CBS 6097]